MHSPMQSLGESNTQPRTPCSASGECGGRRSARGPVAVAAARRRERFKSGGPPAPSAIESIIWLRNEILPGYANKCYWILFTGCSQEGTKYFIGCLDAIKHLNSPSKAALLW